MLREHRANGMAQAVATPSDAEAEYGLYRHRAWWSKVEQLERLAAELRRYGITAWLVSDQTCPSVRLTLPGSDGDRVHLSRRDGEEVYEWSSVCGRHPATAPEGAARRMATQLRHEQRLNRSA